MNSAVGRQQGISDGQLADLAGFEMSPQFSEQDKVVLRYAEGMTRTPANVPDVLFAELKRRFNTVQIVELTAMIALENFRSRFNRALNIESDGFCDLPANHPVRRATLRNS